ncbi:pleckstrin homology domain-containing family A member 7 [Electrophorus electricus]|uniref:pleckstrin homology domain-containing family A member 7 n=1 Tax=Electrophorus electricus TaxID=8005 RepID=UPI0015D09BF4|nr:pleckstrin homology domain-containing family A member 7 [Electrophorus electricus]
MAAPLRRDTLPENWTYGVCRDGRVFFIDDEKRTTTWLHPRTGEPVNSGHMIRSDLPKGWEEGFTKEGASFFIDHNQRKTTFTHPVTEQLSPESAGFRLLEQPSGRMPKPQTTVCPSSTVSEASTTVNSSTVDITPASKSSRYSGRVHSFGKRDNAIKRNPNVEVVVRGWLFKQDSSGMRLWRRKWFVLADYCLFYYKDSREENVLGSIPLPSYTISPVGPEDHISRKYAFRASHTGMRSYIYKQSSVIGSQAEHSGMRTYYFSADTQDDMNSWVRAMNQAALMQNFTMKRVSEELDCAHCLDACEKHHTVPEINRINSCMLPLAEGPHTDEVHLPKLREEGSSLPEMELARGKSPGLRALEVEVLSPEAPPPTQAPSRVPSRSAATLPASFRNGVVLEQNGVGIYQRGPTPQTNSPTKAQRRTTLEQVENWVKVQKGDHRGALPNEGTLRRQTSPAHPMVEVALQAQPSALTSLPTVNHQLPSDYKYAQDRLSHLWAVQGQPSQSTSRDATVWQLYEWQQRQQYRHASPTAPIYVPAPDYSTAVSSARTNPDVARSVSVPPAPADLPPPGPSGPRLLSPRRPHTPAERVTVRPLEDRPAMEVPLSISPRQIRCQKSATIERRSVPPSGYITHTFSAPSLHGKTPEELTLLLIQLRRHQAMMAGVRSQTLAHLRQLSHVQADDTYVQLKKDLDYLDLKMKSVEPLILMVHGVLQTCSAGALAPLWNMTGSETLKGRPAKPVKVAESDVDVKLSRLCEQDKILQELGLRLSTLKEDKDKLESVLDVSHQQMEQYQEQPTHAEKIAYQQRLLQEDLVHIRADISRVATEMQRAWEEYGRLEQSVEQLREALQIQMNICTVPQEKTQLKRELWRIEDVMAGLSSTKDTFKITVDSVQNPERKLVPSVKELSVPSRCVTTADIQSPQHSLISSPVPLPSENSAQLPQHVPTWEEDSAPPRPPLPLLYDEDTPPAVPPLPKETSVIRHMSVRGLKRQSDERKRDRESGYVNGDCRAELRSYLSEPELRGIRSMLEQLEGGSPTLPNRGVLVPSFSLNQPSVSYNSTLREDSATMERLKSASEQLYSGEPGQPHHRGRMSVEEQLDRMKRHQRALVRERKRNLSHAERQSSVPRGSSRAVSSNLGPLRWEEGFDLQLLESPLQWEELHIAESRGREEQTPNTESWQIPLSDEWLTVMAKPLQVQDLEPVDFDVDIAFHS